MVRIAEYCPEKHDGFLREWLQAHSIEPVAFPVLGFVALNGDKVAVAAAFLRLVEGNDGLLDYLISNPKASASDRNRCIQAAGERVILLAQELGLNGLIAHSKDTHTIKRCIEYGFEKKEHVVLFLKLPGGI